jgi:hypothetical protein
LSKRSFHKVVRYHHPSNDKDILWANHGVSQLLNSTSEGPESTRTCTLQLPQLMFHFKRFLDERRTWVTPYQEVHISWSPPWGQMSHLRNKHGEKSCSKDLKHWTLAGR